MRDSLLLHVQHLVKKTKHARNWLSQRPAVWRSINNNDQRGATERIAWRVAVKPPIISVGVKRKQPGRGGGGWEKHRPQKLSPKCDFPLRFGLRTKWNMWSVGPPGFTVPPHLMTHPVNVTRANPASLWTCYSSSWHHMASDAKREGLTIFPPIVLKAGLHG